MTKLRRVIRRYDSYWWKEPWAGYRLRLSIALLLSLCCHAFILSLNFGAPGLGLPGFAFPWLERRVQASDITVWLTNVPRPGLPNSTSAPVLPRMQSFTSTSIPPKPVKPLRAKESLEVSPTQDALPMRPQESPSLPLKETNDLVPASGAPVPGQDARSPQPEILAQKNPQQETFNVPPVSRTEPGRLRTTDSAARTHSDGLPTAQETEAVLKQAEEKAAKLLVEQELNAREEARIKAEHEALKHDLTLAQELDAQKQEEALRFHEVKKQEEAQRQALELEAQRRAEEIARSAAEERERQGALARQKVQEVKRLEDARRIDETQKQKEAMKKEEARRIAALEMETLRRAEEAARQLAVDHQKELESRRQAEEAAVQVRARETAERQRLEGVAAAQREGLAAEQAASRAAAGVISESGPTDAPPAPNAVSGRDLAATALDQLRSRDPARTDAPLLPSQTKRDDDSTRRRSIFGAERDVMLRMYVDSWRWRIERNGSLNYSSSASWRARDHPVATVAIRSDGSLETVLIHRSSGLRDIDEAVKRIARLYAPYSAFPPALARQFDVIEIRRVWNFDGPLRILEEPR